MTELVKSLGIEWHILLAQVINFAILLFVLTRFVYKPVMRLLDERKEAVRKAAEQNEKSAQKLMAADTEREKILAEARVLSSKLIEEAKKDGEQLKGKMVSAAKEEIVKLKAEQEKKQRNDKVRLLAEVRAEIGGLIVDTIEKALGDVLDARAQGKMVEQALAAIRESNGRISKSESRISKK